MLRRSGLVGRSGRADATMRAMLGSEAAAGAPHRGAGRRRARRGTRRTLALVESISDEDLERVHSTLMSPLVWDLGHIAAFEDLWIVHRYGGRPLLREGLAEVYDAFETPRAGRGALPFLRPPRGPRVPRRGPPARLGRDRPARRRRRGPGRADHPPRAAAQRDDAADDPARPPGRLPHRHPGAESGAGRTPPGARKNLRIARLSTGSRSRPASARSGRCRTASPTTTSAPATAPTSAAT